MNQYNYNHKLRKGSIFFVTLVLLIILIVTTNQNRSIMTLGGNAIGTITSPITRVIYVTSNRFGEIFTSVFGTRELRQEHARLTLENQELKERLNVAENVISRENYLKNEYELIQNSKNTYLAANVSGKEPGNIFSHLIVNKGSFNGVQVGDSVVQGILNEENETTEGLVGTVIEVGLNWSKVSTIVDEQNSVSFRINRNEETGILEGGKEGLLQGFSYNKDADIRPGDSIYTTGYGGVYPGDIYIGEVTRTLEDENDLMKRVEVRSPVDFEKVYRVLIVSNGENK